MNSVTFRYINGFTCQILNDKLPFPFGKDGMSPDTIVRVGEEVLLMRDMDYSKHIWRLEELRWEVSNIEASTKWRSEERRLKTIEYYKKIISLMTSYKREVTIDEILTKENYFDTLCLAC